MTGEAPLQAQLRQLSSSLALAEGQSCYLLVQHEVTVLGRDPRCQIVLDSLAYGVVSRRHAEIRPAQGDQRQPGAASWWVCDLNSSNGTYVNGERLQGCRLLYPGDRILLGHNGPEFIFEYPAGTFNAPRVSTLPPPGTPLNYPSAFPAPSRERVTLTQLFPIFSTGGELTQKAYLAPAMITIGFVVLMFAAVGDARAFNLLLAAYLAGAAYYFVYRLCGKHKPWWVLVGAAALTALILSSPLLAVFIRVFRQILPGQVPAPDEVISFPLLLVRMFFGAGLMEELIKALPILGFWLLGLMLRSPWRQRIGVVEPLDGILLGTASAIGFTLLETLGQYVPQITQNTPLQAGENIGQLVGLQLLIPRILGSVAGHMAYSGYLGYFIGLSVLKPNGRWLILIVGYLSAAVLHALWNASGSVSPVALAVVGILSYAFLGAAILKARVLSPHRSENFATRLKE